MALSLVSLVTGPVHADDKPKSPAPEKTPPKPDKVAKIEKMDKQPEKAADPEPDLLALTNDPITNKADRIDGDEASGVVAFTFDDGPNPETSPAVIDALVKYNIPATFFIVTQRISGKHGDKGRDVVAREVASGFGIGSHSVTHPNLRTLSQKKMEAEIDNSIKTLSPQIGRPVGLFRAPYGALNAAGRAHLKKLDLTEVFWSIDTLDWASHNADRLRKRTLQMIVKQNGGVVLMHDVKPITAKVAAQIFDDLEAENCKRLADAAIPDPPTPPPDPPDDPNAPKDPKAKPKAKKPPPPPPRKKLEPIIPVSLHYFLKDGKTSRAIPDDVKARTETYRIALPGRCLARATAVAQPTDPTPKK